MINQKAISAKLNFNVLKMIDDESKVSLKSRNRIINDAIRLYCDNQDLQRTIRSHGRGSEAARIAAANYLKKYVCPEAHVYYDMIDL